MFRLHFRLMIYSALVIAGGVHTSAAVPPSFMEHARQRAAMHIQIDQLDVTVPERTPGTCVVSGRVAHVFDDRLGILTVGQAITVEISCRRDDDQLPISGTLWTSVKDLQRAGFLEAYLDMYADSHHPRGCTLNYSLSRERILESSLDSEYREAHFTVLIRKVSHHEGDRLVTVQAEVDRIIRDTSGLLSRGQEFELPLDCDCRARGAARTPNCGEIVRSEGHFAEVAFYLGIPFDQVRVISELTSRPTCPRDAKGRWCE